MHAICTERKTKGERDRADTKDAESALRHRCGFCAWVAREPDTKAGYGNERQEATRQFEDAESALRHMAHPNVIALLDAFTRGPPPQARP